ncbi:hypothetical protein U9M48_040004 [Paspalum notatum var. saurae]|uniref:Retrovirus-related Pol polyprotein from transposon TNT 1-94-like beta-barrel domain-containing protein n=1 Tax=Paspalum notatum var. saurae TaxID=547442 RepID=A0AAQ3XF55_PASNO
MALEDKENKDDGSNSSSDDEDRGMEDVWIMDSGCSRHMTGHRKWFSSLNPMSREFEMSLMGELQFFLGLQIKLALKEPLSIKQSTQGTYSRSLTWGILNP